MTTPVGDIDPTLARKAENRRRELARNRTNTLTGVAGTESTSTMWSGEIAREPKPDGDDG